MSKPTVRETNRGVEVTVPASSGGTHTVVVTTGNHRGLRPDPVSGP